MNAAGVSARSREQVLDDLVRDEITGGARVDHRDTVTAVLTKGRHRLLVSVDGSGAVHIDRLERPGRRRVQLVAIAGTALVAVLVVVLLLQVGSPPVGAA